VVGKGDKVRQVLIPAVIAARLLASRGDAPASALVFESVRNPSHAPTDRAVNFIVKAAARRAGVNPAASMHWLRHAHASHAIDNGATITLVSATLGHADLKTTSVYAHARPGESSGPLEEGHHAQADCEAVATARGWPQAVCRRHRGCRSP
jgi:integrase/recombinase XerD